MESMASTIITVANMVSTEVGRLIGLKKIKMPYSFVRLLQAHAGHSIKLLSAFQPDNLYRLTSVGLSVKMALR